MSPRVNLYPKTKMGRLYVLQGKYRSQKWDNLTMSKDEIEIKQSLSDYIKNEKGRYRIVLVRE